MAIITLAKALKLKNRLAHTGGESFLTEQFLLDYLAPDDASSIRDPGVPMLAADPGSKAFRDRLYLVWSERTRAGTRVMLVRSRDKGVSWSAPIALSEPPDTQRRAQGSSHHACLPSIAVSRAGVVAVSWYDVSSHEGKFRCDVRLRASIDGGDSWLPSAPVTDVTSVYEQATWMGDTAGLAADAAGTFHPLWIDNRTGVKQAFTTRVTVD